METAGMAAGERDAERQRVMRVLSEHLRNNMRKQQETGGTGADFVAFSGSKSEDRKEQWQAVSVKLSSHLQQRQKELADREVKRKTTLAAIRKGEERRRVEKVLNAHLLTKLSRTAYTEVAETSGSDKWEWEREKVSKLLSEHLRFRKKFKKTTENEAIDTNQTDKQKVADMLSEHLRVKIQMKHVSPSSSSPAGKSEKQIAAEKISALLRAKMQKEQTGLGESKKMDKKRVAEMLSEHLRMKIRKAKGLESSVETTAMDKQRVAAMLSEHLRVKMQQAFTAKQTPHADVTIDATEKQRVAEMLSEHLRIKMRQMQQQPTAPETAHAVFAAPANEGVELASIDKEKVALMLEQHLPAKIERQRQLEQREQREDGRIDKKRVADMLSKHLRTKVQRARAMQAEREAKDRHKKHVREVLTSHLETVCKTRLGLGLSSSGPPSTTSSSTTTTDGPASAASSAATTLKAGAGAASGPALLPSGEHLQKLFDLFLETLDMDTSQVYRQLGSLSEEELMLRLQSSAPEAEEDGELAPLLRSLFLHLLTAPDEADETLAHPAAAAQQPTLKPTTLLRSARSTKTSVVNAPPVAAPTPPPKSTVAMPVSLKAARSYTLQHAWSCAGQRWVRSARERGAEAKESASGTDAQSPKKDAPKAKRSLRVHAPGSMLWTGCAGTEVVRLQRALGSLGFLSLPPKSEGGFFGHLTRDAVTKFQKAHALPPPHAGVYDAASKGALIAALDTAAAAAIRRPLARSASPSPSGAGGCALMVELKAALERKRQEFAQSPPSGIRAGDDVQGRFQGCGPRPADPASPRECLLEEIRTFALALHLRPTPRPADAALAGALLCYQIRRGVQAPVPPPPPPPPPSPPRAATPGLAGAKGLAGPASVPLALCPPPSPLLLTPPPPTLTLPPPPPTLTLTPPPPTLTLSPPPPTLSLTPPPPTLKLTAPVSVAAAAAAKEAKGAKEGLDALSEEPEHKEGLDALREEPEHVEIPQVEVYDGEEELENGVLCFD